MSPAAELRVGLPERLRAEAARLALDAFGAELAPALGAGERAERFLARVIRPAFAVAALDRDGALLGLAGFQNRDGGLFGGDLADFRAVYGPAGLWRAALYGRLGRATAADCLRLDGIMVRPDARGRGLGAALIERVAMLAAEQGARELHLDVALANRRARMLYERHGFRLTGETRARTRVPLLRRPAAAVMARAV